MSSSNTGASIASASGTVPDSAVLLLDAPIPVMANPGTAGPAPVSGDIATFGSGQTTFDPSSSQQEAAQQLQFQEFQHHHVQMPPSSPSSIYSKGPTFGTDDDDGDGLAGDREHDDLLKQGGGRGSRQGTRGGGANASSGPSIPFWEFDFFAQFFDVTQDQVFRRILYSWIPLVKSRADLNGSTYIERQIQPNPDVYGPFWICVTLIFSIAICGNISSWINSTGSEFDSQWHYDFQKLAMAASTVFTYITIVPITLWFFCWFRGCATSYSLLETICAYGYSLSIYVPVSILWLINNSEFRYILVIVAACASGSVLVLSFAPVVQSDPSPTVKTSYIVLALIVILHALLAFSFLTYFF